VHRNVANLVVHTDFSMLSVLQYAVEVLRVNHVIVCGHCGCSGDKNAMSNCDLGLINKWLRNIKDVYRLFHRELTSIADLTLRFERLVELNVCEQVQNLAQTSIVQGGWNKRQAPTLHGWVYNLRTGYLEELARIELGADLDPIDRFDFGPKDDQGRRA